MSSLRFNGNGSTAHGRSSSATIDVSIHEEEHLCEIKPAVREATHPPSPPTANTYHFPSLLECLSDQSPRTAKYPPAMSSDEEDDFDAASRFAMGDSNNAREGTKIPMTTRASTNEIEESQVEEDFQIHDLVGAKSYSVASVIEEARQYYVDEKPEFCVKHPRYKVKSVRLSGEDTKVNIHFTDWNDTLGFWTLADNAGDEYVVKFRRGAYYVWEGIESQFSKQPVAHVLSARRNKAIASRFGSRQLSNQSLIESDRANSLRRRTVMQNNPYTAYNTQKMHEDQGRQLSQVELEQAIHGRLSPANARKNTMSKKRKRDNTISIDIKSCSQSASTVSSGSTCLSGQVIVSEEDIWAHTTFRSKFDGFDLASIPLAMHSCNSNEALFTVLKKKWAFQLEGRRIAYCVASFPWLDVERNVLLQASDAESFECVMTEVREAPGWKGDTGIEVVIKVFASQ